MISCNGNYMDIYNHLRQMVPSKTLALHDALCVARFLTFYISPEKFCQIGCILSIPLFGDANLNIFSCSVVVSNHEDIVSKSIILCASESKIKAQYTFICDHPIYEGHCRKSRKLPLRTVLRRDFQIPLIKHGWWVTCSASGCC